jgi:hypothetical protein
MFSNCICKQQKNKVTKSHNYVLGKEKKDFREEKKVTDVFRTTNYVCTMGFRCLYRVVVEKMGHRTFCMYVGGRIHISGRKRRISARKKR